MKMHHARGAGLLAAAAVLLASTVAAPARADTVTDWNAIATTAIVATAAGAATAAVSDDQPVPQVRTVAGTAITRYFDIEANKAASMRALGLHIARQRENHTSPYQDLQANKARSQRAR